jgi:hypothetical protein
VVGLMLAMQPRLTAAQVEALGRRTARPLPGGGFAWTNDAGARRAAATEDPAHRRRARRSDRGRPRRRRPARHGAVRRRRPEGPHHGSENNVDQAFCDAVVAQHYVFCGNGQHENPDLRVVELMAKRRLAAPVTSAFRFWFNSSSVVSDKPDAVAHMVEVEKLVARLVRSSHGRMSATFLRKGSRLNVL